MCLRQRAPFRPDGCLVHEAHAARDPDHDGPGQAPAEHRVQPALRLPLHHFAPQNTPGDRGSTIDRPARRARQVRETSIHGIVEGEIASPRRQDHRRPAARINPLPVTWIRGPRHETAAGWDLCRHKDALTACGDVVEARNAARTAESGAAYETSSSATRRRRDLWATRLRLSGGAHRPAWNRLPPHPSLGATTPILLPLSPWHRPGEGTPPAPVARGR